MNKKKIELNDVKIPPIVQEKMDLAFSQIQSEQEKKMKNTKSYKIIKRTIAVAACASVAAIGILSSSYFVKNTDKSSIAGNEPAGSNILESVKNSFTLTAYAAEKENVVSNSSDLLMYDIGLGDGGFTGMFFKIAGESIENITITIDKGELYSASIEETNEVALTKWLEMGEEPFEDNDENTHAVLKTGEDGNVTVYHCTRNNQELSTVYEENALYGFYIPDAVMSATENISDLQNGYRTALDTFNDATLSVKVTFSNGDNVTKAYNLHVAKVSVVDGIVKETSDAGYKYGIIATEKK